MTVEGETLEELLPRITQRLPEIYLAFVLPLLIAFALLQPPFWLPDEANHAQRGIQLSHGELLSRPSAEGIGMRMDPGVIALADSGSDVLKILNGAPIPNSPIRERRMLPTPIVVTPGHLPALATLRWVRTATFSRFQNTAVYPPILYLPQALGWWAGRALGLTILQTLLLVRLLAAFSAVLIGWAALRLTRIGRWPLFVYLLLPVLLNVNASCSQDGMLVTIPALAMAIVLRATSARRQFTVPELLCTVSLLAICITARPPYLPLALVLLLPSLETPDLRWRRLLPGLAGVAVVTAALAGWQLAVRPLGLYHAVGANPALQVAYLKHSPFRAALAIGGSVADAPRLLQDEVDAMGELDVRSPRWLRALLLLARLGVIWYAAKDGLRSVEARALLSAALLLSVAGISLAEYIIWTSPGDSHVEGVMARYYLPLLPFALLLLRSRAKKAHAAEHRRIGWGWVSAFAPRAFAVAVLVLTLVLPERLAHRYYGVGLVSALHASEELVAFEKG